MTARLLQITDQNWADIDGYGVGHSFDPRELSLARMVNFVWWWTTSQASKKDVDKFRNRLWRPPAGWEVTHEASPWSPENENSALSALKSALGGKTREDA